MQLFKFENWWFSFLMSLQVNHYVNEKVILDIQVTNFNNKLFSKNAQLGLDTTLLDPSYSVFTFEKFYKKSDLKTHTKLHAGVKDYACNVCLKQFSHVSNLNRHKLTHKKEKPFPCQLCGQRYNQIATLNQHLKKHNNDSNVCLVILQYDL
jgi:uncharacterized Zn-finger protein